MVKTIVYHFNPWTYNINKEFSSKESCVSDLWNPDSFVFAAAK